MQSSRRKATFAGSGWSMNVACSSGATPWARSRSSPVACGLTVSQVRALRAWVCWVSAAKIGITAGLICPVLSESSAVRSSVRQQWAQSPMRTGSSSRPQRVQWKSFGMPAQSTQQGVPSSSPGNRR